MNDTYKKFEQRKKDHIELALMAENQTSELNPFDNFSLIHDALPDFDFDDISIASTRFNMNVRTPFIVSSMTAGHKDGVSINRNLIEACAETSWAMGVGSQRRELTDVSAAKEWHDIRRDFPNVSLFGNLGIAQLITTPIEDIKRLIGALQAQAIIIHCNPLQECIQPEGTPSFKGSWHALSRLIKALSIPVIVKETGCGFASHTLRRLNEIGVNAVDVSGIGGTHWGRIEGHRAVDSPMRQNAANTYKNWGINAIQSVMSAKAQNPSFEIWGSGGVRQGLDAAKLIAIGATTIGFAKPMLAPALKSAEDVIRIMSSIEYELKVAMFCTGSRKLCDLKESACR